MSEKHGLKRKKDGGDGTQCFAMPLTERQQLAYLLSMTAKESQGEAADSGDDIGEKPKSVKKSRLSPTSRINRSINKSGETQLHISATKGDVEGVKRLLKQGANVNITDNADWTPLHEACNRGHYKVAKMLLRAGATVSAEGLEGDTPLHDASSNGHLKVVLLLLKYGAEPHKKNQHGQTAIDVAEGDDIVEALTKFTADMLVHKKSSGTENSTTNPVEKKRSSSSVGTGSSDKSSAPKFDPSKKPKRMISNLEDFLGGSVSPTGNDALDFVHKTPLAKFSDDVKAPSAGVKQKYNKDQARCSAQPSDVEAKHSSVHSTSHKPRLEPYQKWKEMPLKCTAPENSASDEKGFIKAVGHSDIETSASRVQQESKLAHFAKPTVHSESNGAKPMTRPVGENDANVSTLSPVTSATKQCPSSGQEHGVQKLTSPLNTKIPDLVKKASHSHKDIAQRQVSAVAHQRSSESSALNMKDVSSNAQAHVSDGSLKAKSKDRIRVKDFVLGKGDSQKKIGEKDSGSSVEPPSLDIGMALPSSEVLKNSSRVAPKSASTSVSPKKLLRLKCSQLLEDSSDDEHEVPVENAKSAPDVITSKPLPGGESESSTSHARPAPPEKSEQRGLSSKKASSGVTMPGHPANAKPSEAPTAAKVRNADVAVQPKQSKVFLSDSTKLFDALSVNSSLQKARPKYVGDDRKPREHRDSASAPGLLVSEGQREPATLGRGSTEPSICDDFRASKSRKASTEKVQSSLAREDGHLEKASVMDTGTRDCSFGHGKDRPSKGKSSHGLLATHKTGTATSASGKIGKHENNQGCAPAESVVASLASKQVDLTKQQRSEKVVTLENKLTVSNDSLGSDTMNKKAQIAQRFSSSIACRADGKESTSSRNQAKAPVASSVIGIPSKPSGEVLENRPQKLVPVSSVEHSVQSQSIYVRHQAPVVHEHIIECRPKSDKHKRSAALGDVKSSSADNADCVHHRKRQRLDIQESGTSQKVVHKGLPAEDKVSRSDKSVLLSDIKSGQDAMERSRNLNRSDVNISKPTSSDAVVASPSNVSGHGFVLVKQEPLDKLSLANESSALAKEPTTKPVGGDSKSNSAIFQERQLPKYDPIVSTDERVASSQVKSKGLRSSNESKRMKSSQEEKEEFTDSTVAFSGNTARNQLKHEKTSELCSFSSKSTLKSVSPDVERKQVCEDELSAARDNSGKIDSLSQQRLCDELQESASAVSQVLVKKEESEVEKLPCTTGSMLCVDDKRDCHLIEGKGSHVGGSKYKNEISELRKAGMTATEVTADEKRNSQTGGEVAKDKVKKQESKCGKLYSTNDSAASLQNKRDLHHVGRKPNEDCRDKTKREDPKTVKLSSTAGSVVSGMEKPDMHVSGRKGDEFVHDKIKREEFEFALSVPDKRDSSKSNEDSLQKTRKVALETGTPISANASVKPVYDKLDAHLPSGKTKEVGMDKVKMEESGSEKLSSTTGSVVGVHTQNIRVAHIASRNAQDGGKIKATTSDSAREKVHSGASSVENEENKRDIRIASAQANKLANEKSRREDFAAENLTSSTAFLESLPDKRDLHVSSRKPSDVCKGMTRRESCDAEKLSAATGTVASEQDTHHVHVSGKKASDVGKSKLKKEEVDAERPLSSIASVENLQDKRDIYPSSRKTNDSRKDKVKNEVSKAEKLCPASGFALSAQDKLDMHIASKKTKSFSVDKVKRDVPDAEKLSSMKNSESLRDKREAHLSSRKTTKFKEVDLNERVGLNCVAVRLDEMTRKRKKKSIDKTEGEKEKEMRESATDVPDGLSDCLKGTPLLTKAGHDSINLANARMNSKLRPVQVSGSFDNLTSSSLSSEIRCDKPRPIIDDPSGTTATSGKREACEKVSDVPEPAKIKSSKASFACHESKDAKNSEDVAAGKRRLRRVGLPADVAVDQTSSGLPATSSCSLKCFDNLDEKRSLSANDVSNQTRTHTADLTTEDGGNPVADDALAASLLLESENAVENLLNMEGDVEGGNDSNYNVHVDEKCNPSLLFDTFMFDSATAGGGVIPDVSQPPIGSQEKLCHVLPVAKAELELLFTSSSINSSTVCPDKITTGLAEPKMASASVDCVLGVYDSFLLSSQLPCGQALALDSLLGVPPTFDTVTGVPPNFDPVTGLPPNFDPVTGVPPNFDPVTGVPPTFDPVTGVPPSFDPVTGLPPNFDPVTGLSPNFDQVVAVSHRSHQTFASHRISEIAPLASDEDMSTKDCPVLLSVGSSLSLSGSLKLSRADPVSIVIECCEVAPISFHAELLEPAVFEDAILVDSAWPVESFVKSFEDAVVECVLSTPGTVHLLAPDSFGTADFFAGAPVPQLASESAMQNAALYGCPTLTVPSDARCVYDRSIEMQGLPFGDDVSNHNISLASQYSHGVGNRESFSGPHVDIMDVSLGQERVFALNSAPEPERDVLFVCSSSSSLLTTYEMCPAGIAKLDAVMPEPPVSPLVAVQADSHCKDSSILDNVDQPELTKGSSLCEVRPLFSIDSEPHQQVASNSLPSSGGNFLQSKLEQANLCRVSFSGDEVKNRGISEGILQFKTDVMTPVTSDALNIYAREKCDDESITVEQVEASDRFASKPFYGYLASRSFSNDSGSFASDRSISIEPFSNLVSTCKISPSIADLTAASESRRSLASVSMSARLSPATFSAHSSVAKPLHVNTATPSFSPADDKLRSPRLRYNDDKFYSLRQSSSDIDASQIAGTNVRRDGQHSKIDLGGCSVIRAISSGDADDLSQLGVTDDPLLEKCEPTEVRKENAESKPSPIRTRNGALLSRLEKKRGLAAAPLLTWRQALKARCSFVETHPAADNFEKLIEPAIKSNMEFLSQDISNQSGAATDLLLQQAFEIERLNKQLVLELSRIECRSKVVSEEKGPVGASIIVHYQRDEIARKLKSSLKFESKSSTLPDVGKLRLAWIDDVLAKFGSMRMAMSRRHEMERDMLAKQAILESNALNQKEILRQRYRRMRSSLHL